MGAFFWIRDLGVIGRQRPAASSNLLILMAGRSFSSPCHLRFRKTWNPTAYGGGHVLMALP